MTADNIYNIGILAHVDAGKTTLTEQFLALSGAIRKAGSVDSGTAQTDWLSVERERGISVRAAQTTFLWRGKQINLIDTPGHVDFAGEVERSLAAMDGAILVISAVEGVQSHTENIWRALCELKLPTLLFINKIDRAGSRFASLCDEIPRLLSFFGQTLLPLTAARDEGQKTFAVEPVAEAARRVTEAVADYDDAIAERYLEGERIESGALLSALAACVKRRQVVPVFCGCARKGVGVKELLDAVPALLPPASARLREGLSALVFRVEHDKSMGKIAHVRLYGGELHARDLLPTGGAGEKISQIRKFNGQKYTDVGTVGAGDIAALCGLSSVRAFDVLGDGAPVDRYRLANPFLSVRVRPENGAEPTALLTALRELSDEDPLLDCKWEKSTREILISVTGRIQLEVLAALLKERYGLTAVFSEPSVIYKETPARSGFGADRYTMPKPCWAVVKLRFDPLPRGSGVVYDGGHVPNDRCFYRYQEHIKKSFFANLGQGRLGWEVTDFKATLIDAEHHVVHTHPLDFFVCTPMAIMDGLVNTGSTLLEPFLRVRLTADAGYMGRIIGDITQMRGEFDTPVLSGDSFTVEAALPAATSLDYPVRLAALTHGTGLFFSAFDGYRECPLELGQTAERRGPDPKDRSKWILFARGAMTNEEYALI